MIIIHVEGYRAPSKNNREEIYEQTSCVSQITRLTVLDARRGSRSARRLPAASILRVNYSWKLFRAMKTRGKSTLSLTFLLDHEDLIVDLLAQQDRMQVVKESLQMLQPVAEWNDYGDAMPGDAVHGSTRAARFHLRE